VLKSSAIFEFSVAIIKKLRKSPDLSIYGSSMVAKKYRNMFFFILSYLACSQIWLNLRVDLRHFGYITKLTPKKNCGISAFLRSVTESTVGRTVGSTVSFRRCWAAAGGSRLLRVFWGAKVNVFRVWCSTAESFKPLPLLSWGFGRHNTRSSTAGACAAAVVGVQFSSSL
jgi:hypothetical protein